MSKKIVCVKDYEEWAKSIMSLNSKVYFNSGATDEQTLEDNEKAFKRWRFRPKVLQGFSEVDTSTSVLGTKISFPVCIAPTGLQKMAHPDGEIAVAKATAKYRTGFTMACLSTSTLEEVAKEVPDIIRWYQLYLYKNRSLTVELIRRAEAAGYSGLILTVDCPFFGNKYNIKKHGFEFPNHLSIDLFTDSERKNYRNGFPDHSNVEKATCFGHLLFDGSMKWADYDWLKSVTKLPIAIKGILTAEMAEEAVQHNVDAIIVSNHGARQLDGVFATIDALPDVVEAVAGRCEVYMDGGVRSGADVAKAIALGAKAVFVGRPVIWGLTCQGEDGVDRLLSILKNELVETMKLLGEIA